MIPLGFYTRWGIIPNSTVLLISIKEEFLQSGSLYVNTSFDTYLEEQEQHNK